MNEMREDGNTQSKLDKGNEVVRKPWSVPGYSRTIFEYLLSPVMKAFQEAGRER
jgi:hypothetical protein